MSVAIIGACLVSCFVSIANPWFYTTKCGENGCPACHKVAERGRADATASAAHISSRARQATHDFPVQGRHVSDPLSDDGPRKRSWLQRGCGWEPKGEASAAEMHGNLDAATATPSSFLGTPGIASRCEQYRGTLPMQITAEEVDGSGRDGGTVGRTGPVSFGADVSHMAPAPAPVGPTTIGRERAYSNAETERDGRHMPQYESREIERAHPEVIEETALKGSKEWDNVAAMSISDATRQTHVPSRPLLDEAISWDRLTGENNNQRKWWRMP